MIHHFYALGAVIPAAQAALASIGAELREAFAGPEARRLETRSQKGKT